MWEITTISGEKYDAPIISIDGPGCLGLKSKVRVKKSYDKKTGFLWWRKIETVTEYEDREIWFALIPLSQIQIAIWSKDKEEIKEV